jgi:hypothetical protein
MYAIASYPQIIKITTTNVAKFIQMTITIIGKI